MFDIDETYNESSLDYPIISGNYSIFHFDEFPILFGGTNYLGNKIIGSLIYEDEEQDIFWYFHSVLPNKNYIDFIKQKITYRDLIKSQKAIFILSKDLNDNINKTYLVPIDLIPLEYLPVEGLYCPNTEKALGYEFSFSLQGMIADMHSALLGPVKTITNSAGKILENVVNSLSIKNFSPDVQLIPSTEGSFRINFKLVVTTNELFFNDISFKKYVSEFLDYSLNSFSKEANQITNKNLQGTRFEETLLPSLESVYESFHQKFTDVDIDKAIKAVVDSTYEIDTLSNEVGKGFDSIEIISTENKDVPIAFIDKEYSNQISNLVEAVSESGKTVISDTEYKEYRIQVYNLNADTRRGNVHIFRNQSEMDNPRMKVEGDTPLTGSVFTESLHLSKWIVVKAKAHVINGKYVSMVIQNPAIEPTTQDSVWPDWLASQTES